MRVDPRLLTCRLHALCVKARGHLLIDETHDPAVDLGPAAHADSHALADKEPVEAVEPPEISIFFDKHVARTSKAAQEIHAGAAVLGRMVAGIWISASTDRCVLRR